MEPLTALLNVQAGLVSLKQLTNLGFTRARIRANLTAGRWVKHSHQVIATFTGELSREQLRWLGALHGGPEALIGGLSALEVHGLKGWDRPDVTVLVPLQRRATELPGLTIHRFARLEAPRRRRHLPLQRVEPAALWFASTEPRPRTAHGLLAAVVQQRLSTPERLQTALDQLTPLQGAREIRRVLAEFAGGAQSMAEVDLADFCKEFGFVLPVRQRCRTDDTGKVRFTDADLRRQRALGREGVVIWRCTAYELRNEPDELAHRMRLLGVPRVGQ
jgi:hypothetical protein